MTSILKIGKLLFFGLGLLVLISSCNKDDDHLPELNYLVDYQELATISASSIRSTIILSQLDFPTDELIYDVTIYKVRYRTHYKNDEIIASGLVAIPDVEVTKGILSFQHGTIAADQEAPSNESPGSITLKIYGAFSAAGLIVSVPDYIGFGSSVELMHPYYVEDLTATAVVDQVYASSELAMVLKLDQEKDLYLAGYSQGGYATMATHKYIEEIGIDDYDLVASFPSSGGYDVVGMRDFFFEQESYHQPFFIAYVAEAYRQSYGWDESLSKYFNEPYASNIPGYFDGSLSGSEINALLTDNIGQLVKEDYLINTNGTDYDLINTAFAENSLTDWDPEIDMYMYHGDADITVPYQNSVEVYESFDPDIVTFLTIQGGTHGTSFYPYLEDMANRLNDYIN